MAEWVNTESGEVCSAECPLCHETKSWAEAQVRAMELERRSDRAARTKAENAAERAASSKRDGKMWAEILGAWQLAFPDKRPKATGVKSARAQRTFERLESGASVEDVKDAIAGCMALPFVVFGKRRATGSDSDRADDLADIVSVNNDANFDLLAATGNELRGPRGGESVPSEQG